MHASSICRLERALNSYSMGVQVCIELKILVVGSAIHVAMMVKLLYKLDHTLQIASKKYFG